MPRNRTPQTLEKRLRERRKAEKREEKRHRRMDRKAEKDHMRERGAEATYGSFEPLPDEEQRDEDAGPTMPSR